MNFISFLLFVGILFISLKYTVTSKAYENICMKMFKELTEFTVYFSSQKIYFLESKEMDTAPHFRGHFHFICDNFEILKWHTTLSPSRPNSTVNTKCTTLCYRWKMYIDMFTCHKI